MITRSTRIVLFAVIFINFALAGGVVNYSGTYSARPKKGKAQAVRMHTREKWQLSSDGKMLTIKTEVDFPDMPSMVTALAIPNNPWTETFQRADVP